MTERLADLTAHLRSVNQLGAVMSAMRGIAASRAQQSRTALTSIQTYAATVGAAIASALRLQPPERSSSPAPVRATLIVLFAPEQGFVGTLLDRVLDAAVQAQPSVLFIVGSRGAMLAAAHGLSPSWQIAQASHPDGIPAVATALAAALLGRLERDDADAVEIILPVVSGQSGIAIDRRSLMPLDLHRFAETKSGVEPPLTTLAPSELLAALTEEYVFAELCEAAMQAFSAENEARVIAMASAKRNIEKLVGDLQARGRDVRQAEITAEVVELAAGSRLFRATRHQTDAGER